LFGFEEHIGDALVESELFVLLPDGLKELVFVGDILLLDVVGLLLGVVVFAPELGDDLLVLFDLLLQGGVVHLELVHFMLL
jgi:hypothetical protein